ncbi:Aspartate/glutamate/uridylate kinase OS=Pirellula staleyi (strain ATCC 27377 / DSM 6068 / ICPB 4128) GN=Psta_3593 PE=4 SV=1 [Gemmata massiliana]|uniref:Aspartate/glutamate/uridylate kinase n=1 Tax=Gemmata massiliana TaxID=1210884 RepID=A0A6P2CVT9_9BACT|nr:hypothetical protein [Gemmata massiliana]VTR91824.1 Aspartate/glutamate/uridylate kinase OS=Pirellula staleyi (strain ATCC 27377 / DSM 6068 / ICPB 4128) GN=Psta_3593 PE=4 SV=1 [Gemmata massiliana]
MIVVKVGGSLFDSPALGPALRTFIESLKPADVLLVPGGGPVADAVRELDRTHGLGEEASHWLALQALSVTKAFLERVVGREPNPLTPFPKKEGGTEPNTQTTTPQAPVLSPSPFRGEVGEGFEAPPLPEGKGEKERSSCVIPISETSYVSSPFPSGRGGRGGGCVRIGVLDCFAFALEDEGRPGALPHSWSVTTDSIAVRAALVFRAERLILLKSVDVPPGTSWEVATANGWVDTHFPQIAQTLTCPIEIVNFRSRLGAGGRS